MRPESFHADDLARVLRRGKVATMPELKKALGTEVDVTVFRKLKQLSYRTSYSHRGSYYTLNETAQFDAKGLWSFDSVWFSRQGTLLATAQALVKNSEAGYFVEELDDVLHVGTKDPLLRLVEQQRIARESLSCCPKTNSHSIRVETVVPLAEGVVFNEVEFTYFRLGERDSCIVFAWKQIGGDAEASVGFGGTDKVEHGFHIG